MSRPARRSAPAAAPGSALAAFVAEKSAFDDLALELIELSQDHFGVDPGAVNWGHVGDLRRAVIALRSVTDAYLGRGEFAPDPAPAPAAAPARRSRRRASAAG